MTKAELQVQLLASATSLARLASAISRLPESETKREMVIKHDKVLDRFSDMVIELMLIDKSACYYGFTNKCPGVSCMECEYFIGE